ncbi:MAG: response regulator [Pseudomonadota bacterium]
MYSVLIIDDDAVDRLALKRALSGQAGVSHVFEEINGENAINFFVGYSANKRRYGEIYPPRLIIVDLSMPKIDGPGFLEAFAELRRINPDLNSRVIVYSASESNDTPDYASDFEFVAAQWVKGQPLEALLAPLTINALAS